MASPFAEAIMSNMVESMNPARAMEKEAIRSFIDSQNDEVQIRKAHAIAEIAELLAKSKSDDAPPAVTNAYEKILAKLSS